MGTELLTRKMDLIHSYTKTSYSWVDRLSFDTLYPTKISGIIVKAFIATSSYMKNTYGTNNSVVYLSQEHTKFIIEYGSEKIVEIPLKNVLDFEGNPFKSNGFIKGDYVLTIIDIDNKKIYLNSLMNADRNNLSSMSYIEKYRRELNYYCNGYTDNVVLQEIIDNLISFYDDRVNKDLNNEVKDKDGNIEKIRDEFDLSLTVDNKNNIFTNGKFTINIIGKFGIDYSQTKFTYGGFNRQNRSSIMTIRGTYTNINDYMRYDKNDKDMELILDWDKCYIPKIEYNNETCAALYNTKKYLRSNDGSVKYIDYWTEEEEAHFVDNNGIPYGNLFPRRLIFASIEGVLPLNITMKNLSLTTFGVGIYCETESKKILKILDSKINILSTASSISTDIPGNNSKFDITNDDNFYKMMPVPAGCAVDINCILPTVEINNCKFKNALNNMHSNLIINSCIDMKITNSFIKDFADYNDGYKDAFVTSCLDYEYFYDYEYNLEAFHNYELNSTGNISLLPNGQCSNPNFQDIIILSTLFYNSDDTFPRIRIPNKMILKKKTYDEFYTEEEFKKLDFSDLLGNYCHNITISDDNLISVVGDYFKIKSKFKGGNFGNTCAVIKNIPVLYREANNSYYMRNVFNVNENYDYKNSLRLSDYHENSKNFFYGNKETEYMPNILIESSTIRAVGVLYQYNANTRISNTKIDAYFYGTAFNIDPINLISGDLTISNSECNFDTRIEINNIKVKNIEDYNIYGNSYCPSFIKVYPIIHNIKDPENDIPFYNTSSSIVFDKNPEFLTYGNQLISPSVTILTPSKLNISNSKFTLYPDTIFNIPRITDNNTTIYMKRLNGEEIELNNSKTLRFISTISNDLDHEYTENLSNNTKSFFNPNTAPNINIDSSEFLIVNNMCKRENMVYTLTDRALCRVVKKLSNGSTTEYELYPEDLAHTGFYIYDYIPELVNYYIDKDNALLQIRKRYNRFGVTAFKLENVIFNMNNCNIGSHSGNYIRNTYGYETMVRRTPRICFDFRSSGIYHINNTKANAWGTVLWSEIHNTAYLDYYKNYNNMIAPFDSSTIDLTNKGECIINNCNFMNYSYLRFRRTSEDWIDYLDLDSYNKTVDGTSKKEIFDKSNKSYSLNNSELRDMTSLRKKELTINKQQTFESNNSNYSNIQAYNESVRNGNEMPIIYIANSPLVDTQINFGHIKGNETVIIEGNISFNNVNYHNNNNAMVCYINKIGIMQPPVVYFNNCEINATKDVIMDKYVDRDNGRENTRYRPVELDFSDRGMTKYNNVITPFYVETDECYLELNGNKITFKCNAYDDIYGIDSSARVRLLYYNKFNYIYYNMKNYNTSFNFINNNVSMLFDFPKKNNKKVIPIAKNICVIDLTQQDYSSNKGSVYVQKNININNNTFNIGLCVVNNNISIYDLNLNNNENKYYIIKEGMYGIIFHDKTALDNEKDEIVSNNISLNIFKNPYSIMVPENTIYYDNGKKEYKFADSSVTSNFEYKFRHTTALLAYGRFISMVNPKDLSDLKLNVSFENFAAPIIYSTPFTSINFNNNFINNTTDKYFKNELNKYKLNIIFRSMILQTFYDENNNFYIPYKDSKVKININMNNNILYKSKIEYDSNILKFKDNDDIIKIEDLNFMMDDTHNVILNTVKNNIMNFDKKYNIIDTDSIYDKYIYSKVRLNEILVENNPLILHDYLNINVNLFENNYNMKLLFGGSNNLKVNNDGAIYYRNDNDEDGNKWDDKFSTIQCIKRFRAGYYNICNPKYPDMFVEKDDINFNNSEILFKGSGLKHTENGNDRIKYLHESDYPVATIVFKKDYYGKTTYKNEDGTGISYKVIKFTAGTSYPAIIYGENFKCNLSDPSQILSEQIQVFRTVKQNNEYYIPKQGYKDYCFKLSLKDKKLLDEHYQLFYIFFDSGLINEDVMNKTDFINTHNLEKYDKSYYDAEATYYPDDRRFTKTEYDEIANIIDIYIPIRSNDDENNHNTIYLFHDAGSFYFNKFNLDLKEGYYLHNLIFDTKATGQNTYKLANKSYNASENPNKLYDVYNYHDYNTLYKKEDIEKIIIKDPDTNNLYITKIDNVIFESDIIYDETDRGITNNAKDNILSNYSQNQLLLLNCFEDKNESLYDDLYNINFNNNICINSNTTLNNYLSQSNMSDIKNTLSDIYGNIDS